ncbi:tRNA (adenosine(37)-N6)-dimethylallyltransferase MiaA [Reichenbachiella carrageenanivorans]|uniref:tRNA dimethylallyltransferase n=1 Tax=Reichenbachiella carrageenanivorans TaxID=2979869 RepID=A0ABY6CWR3_9BACT|nr:tRNA (adenosine(37)-N6)-dimethylallyltransferase MiaA [Reichenbachiella carrageenanivorans]UXX78332.1 tRNA (adenosine(37)-N6)-dimethylallyltransferase MiaA [Reichenbachiella carrageenanivorans]
MSKQNLLVVVVGPTAVGKTGLTIALAQHFGGDIISCDSRQFYREMEIGTAKPSPEELAQASHHFVNTHSIHDDYDAGAFADEAECLLADLFKKQQVQFMVGGSGLYVKAFCDGLDKMPETDLVLRATLNKQLAEEGLEGLLAELQSADPVYYDQVDRKNPQRVLRGLEVIRSTGLPYSYFRQGKTTKTHAFKILKIGLEIERPVLYDRIDQRMDEMITQGLFEEAQVLYPYRHKNALHTVGYTEIFGYLEGRYDQKEAVRLLKRNSRRYAKRQMTWFKREEEIVWFKPNQLEEIINRIERQID